MKQKLADSIAALILAVFILTASVVLALNFKPLYYLDIDQLNIPALSGMERAEIVRNYDALIHYNSLFGGGTLQLPSLPMSPEGQIHFSEVRDIFVAVQIGMIVSGVLLLGVALYKLRRREPRFLLYGAVLTVALPLVLGALIALDWQGFFVAFHKLFFNNDYWIFDAVRDPVILMLPDGFFMHCALLILGLVVGLSLLSLLLWLWLRARAKRGARILLGSNTAINGAEVMQILRRSLSLIDRKITEHNARVAYLVYRIMEHAGRLKDIDAEKLFVLALFHDIGTRKIDEIDELLQLETTQVMKHSIYGYLFLKHLSPLGDCAQAILYHHMSYGRLVEAANPYADYAQLIFLADRIDVIRQKNLEGKLDYQALREEKGRRFKPEFVEMFIAADKDLGLVGKCADGTYRQEVDQIADSLSYSKEELLGYLRMIIFIIDFVSAETSVHTANTVQISVELARRAGIAGPMLDAVSYGALLHDIGKIAIPARILEYPSRLSPEDWKIMQGHVRITDEVLEGVVTEEIRGIASRHHEKLDGSGYPKGLSAEELSQPERVVAVADIMSALIGVRSYKASYPKSKVIEILSQMRDDGLLDEELCTLAIKNYDEIVGPAVESQAVIVSAYETILREYREIVGRMNAE